MQVVQVMQVLQVVFSTDPLLHLFTLFSSRPDSYRELPAFTHPLSSFPLAFTYSLSCFPLLSHTPFPVSPRGERLLPLDVVAQFVISDIAVRISPQ